MQDLPPLHVTPLLALVGGPDLDFYQFPIPVDFRQKRISV